MNTRNDRAPLSIKIVIGLMILFLAGRGAALVALMLGKPLHQPWPEFVLAVALMTYQVAGLNRMSRWPIIVQALMVTSSVVIQYATQPHWTDRYPILGVFAVIIPLAIYLALVLPHWRKMNWALLGRPYRPSAQVDEVFA
jgi:hypothetical protein